MFVFLSLFIFLFTQRAPGCRGGREKTSAISAPLLSPRESIKKAPAKKQDALHGITLEQILTELVADIGWQDMGEQIRIKCFNEKLELAMLFIFWLFLCKPAK